MTLQEKNEEEPNSSGCSSLTYSRISSSEVSMSEQGEFSPPDSPNQQSDSDGSVSSGEYSLHLQVSPVKCRWEGCGEWFPHLEHLANHVTTTHAVAGNGGMFYCGWEECARGNRGFNARYKMLVHVRTHTNEKPHHCYQCGKSFSRAENLKIHARSHTGERPYVCPVPGCGKAYSNSSDRFKHTRTHSEDKPYVCKVPGCPKRYTDPSSLRKHVKTYRHYPPAASLPTLSPVQTPQSQHTSPLLALTAPLPLRPLTSSPVSVIRPLSPLPQTGIMKMETDEDKYENKIDERERSDREERYCQMVPWSSVVRWWGDLPLQEAPLDLTSPLKIHHQANS